MSNIIGNVWEFVKRNKRGLAIGAGALAAWGLFDSLSKKNCEDIEVEYDEDRDEYEELEETYETNLEESEDKDEA